MNIKELIERLRLETTPSEITLDFAAEALLAQQAVIEKMREVLARIAACPGDNKLLTAMKWAEEALALQPDLSALRERDAEVCHRVADWVEPQRSDVPARGVGCAAAIREYAERIGKGEA